MSDSGWSGIGVTADFICAESFSNQAAFINRGMLGSYPRRIVGRDLYNVLYFLGRSSQRGFREGKPYFDALKAYCSPMFGQELPQIAQTLPDSSNDIFMRATVTNGVIKVIYHDIWWNPKAPEPGFSASVMVDETTTVGDGAVLSPGQHALRPVSAKTATRQYRGWSSVVTV
jgi:hypothetical protein